MDILIKLCYFGFIFLLKENFADGSTCYYYSGGSSIAVRTCPGSGDCSDESYCCGSGSSQYCCDYSDYSGYGGYSYCSDYYYSSYSYYSFNYAGVIGGAIFGLMVLGGCIFVVVCVCVSMAKKGRGRVHHAGAPSRTVVISQQQQSSVGPIRPPPYSQPVPLQPPPPYQQPPAAQPTQHGAMYPPPQAYPPPAPFDPAYPPPGPATGGAAPY